MAPLRLGEQPTNSETTSIDAFCSAGMSYTTTRQCQQIHEYKSMGFKGLMRGDMAGVSQLIACEKKHDIHSTDRL